MYMHVEYRADMLNRIHACTCTCNTTVTNLPSVHRIRITASYPIFLVR